MMVKTIVFNDAHHLVHQQVIKFNGVNIVYRFRMMVARLASSVTVLYALISQGTPSAVPPK